MKLTTKFGLQKISNDDVVIAPRFSRLGGLESHRVEGRALGMVGRLNPAAHHQRRRGACRCRTRSHRTSPFLPEPTNLGILSPGGPTVPTRFVACSRVSRRLRRDPPELKCRSSVSVRVLLGPPGAGNL